jgi:hypothetical protein
MKSGWFLIIAYVGERNSIKVREGLAVLSPGYYLLLERRNDDGKSEEYSVQFPPLPTLEEAIRHFESWI